jgi:hypothetical protein
MAHLASEVKVEWSPDPDGLIEHAHQIAEIAAAELSAAQHGDAELRTLPPEQERLLLANSISPLPLRAWPCSHPE